MIWERVEEKLDAILTRIGCLETTVKLIGGILMDLNSIIADLNANTNTVAAKQDKLIAEIAALTAAGQPATPEQIAQLQAISDHLKALGADPAAPVPPVPPVLTAPPAPAPTVP
jgi:uncharacterized coiled-coil protein SlyX